MSVGNDSFYEDRRAHKRYSIESPVSVCYLGDFSIQKCVQIGQGGMLLFSENMDWKVGSHIEICFLIPGGKSMILYGEVVYRLHLNGTGNFAGIRFVDVSPSIQSHLSGYIASLEKSL